MSYIDQNLPSILVHEKFPSQNDKLITFYHNSETPCMFILCPQNMNLKISTYSFLFKLVHQILPTAERISRILPNSSPLCTRCQANENETLEHAFFSCRATQTSSSVLLQGLKQFIPTLTASDILRLNFNSEEELNFPLVWCAATFLSSLWKLRTEKKTVELFKIRSELEANCRMLRESRLEVTSSMLSQIF